jgi:hypothetical protein
VTKSGTNNFHGEARIEYQPAAFEADSKDPNLQSTTERFRPGVGIGGPIVKDYLFAYTSANFYRLTQSDRVNDLGPIPNSDLDINEYFFKLSATPAQNMLFDASYRYRSINQSYANVGAFERQSTPATRRWQWTLPGHWRDLSRTARRYWQLSRVLQPMTRADGTTPSCSRSTTTCA